MAIISQCTLVGVYTVVEVEGAILHCSRHWDCPPLSIGLVGSEKGGVHGLHTRGAGEGSHEPVVYTLSVVGVHAGEEPQQVTHGELVHTDDTPGNKRKIHK